MVRRLTHGLLATIVVAALAATTGPATMTATPKAPADRIDNVHVRPALAGHALLANLLPSPLTTSECLSGFGIHCYNPQQFRRAYDLNPLYARGITGAGRTIVIVDAFGSPTLQHDLDGFDAQFGLPHTRVEIIKAGNIPPFDPNDAQSVIWAQESTLDVEWAHAIAPGAHLILVETPVAAVEGTSGLRQMMDAEKRLIDRGVGDVISQSFGNTENTFPGFDRGNYASLLNLRYAFTDAVRHHVTVLAATGDEGATNFMADAATVYPYPVTAWPASDPLVTAVGGTFLDLDDQGHRLAPDTVWNDQFGAGGGADSSVFRRPLFQFGVRSVVGNHRGTPDISITGAVDGGGWVYFSALTPDAPWDLFGGTSMSTPMFAGIVALADQVAGHRLGYINPELYLMGAASRFPHTHTGIVDVTTGDNSFGGVTGFPATAGYDLATGWGTIDANVFVPALARLG